MIKVQDIEELQKVSDYRLLRKSLKGAAIGSIIFGVIAIGMGLAFMSEDPINVILVFIGVFLLVEGIWLIRSPSPRGMIVDGVALCILGIWNIFVAIAGEVGGFVVLGFFQIIWGVQSFRRYRRFSGISSQKPSKEGLRQVDDIVKSVTKTKPSESENIIELQMQNKSWKGELAKDVGIFVDTAGDEVIFARRGEVDFTTSGEVTPGKPQKISIKIGNRSFYGKMSPESMERYESWKRA